MTPKDRLVKCPKTVTGKHLWREYFDGYKSIDEWNPLIAIPNLISKCSACGLIDDRPKPPSRPKRSK